METVGSLGLRSFKSDKEGHVTESTKNGAPVAVHVPFGDYLRSKPFLSQSRLQIVPFSGQELLLDIQDRISARIPGERSWGNVTVYRDHLDIHGYTEKARPGFTLLTPNIPVSEVAFERVITKISILGDDKYSSSIAVKWQPNYAQIAIGINVHICDNYNVFGSKIYQTGREFKYEDMMRDLDKEFESIEEHFNTDVATIGQLISTPVNDRNVKLLVGDMYIRAAEESPILNISELNETVRNMIADKNKGIAVSTLWDLTMHATRALHFNRSSGNETLETISRLNNYLTDKINKN